MACPLYATLPSGARMPLLGYGSWQATDDALEKALQSVLEAGYRHIDTAALYRNEAVIGKVLKQWLSSGRVRREDLFIVTKLPFQGLRPSEVGKWMQRSLEGLGLDYVDLYLVHNPMGLQGETLDFTKGPDGNLLWDHTVDHVAVWKAMEEQVHAGHTKAIGLSNFNRRQIQRILDNCRIKPANLQVELHVYMQQQPLVDFCHKNGITVTAYSPLGSPDSGKVLAAISDTKVEFPSLMTHPVVVEVAKKHNKTPAQVLLRHIVQRGIVAIPKSLTTERIIQNIQLFDFELSSKEMDQLNAIDKGANGRIFDMTFLKGAENHPEFPFNEYP